MQIHVTKVSGETWADNAEDMNALGDVYWEKCKGLIKSETQHREWPGEVESGPCQPLIPRNPRQHALLHRQLPQLHLRLANIHQQLPPQISPLLDRILSAFLCDSQCRSGSTF